ncbi:MAG TPA: hypothetical protein EYP52_06755, partial [Anaerolineae bacterium]|nr:hypothetical protein [Anaerolineae bacterium]
MLLLLLLAVSAVGEKAPSLAAPPPPEPGLRVVEAGPAGLVLEWSSPSVHIAPQRHGEIPRAEETRCPLRLCGGIEVTAEGYDQVATPGADRLPYTATLIALPPGVPPTLHVEVLEEATLSLSGPLAVAPQPAGALRDASGLPVGPAFAPAVGRPPAPASPVTLEEVGIVRGARLARLTFYPAIPDNGLLRLYRRVRVEVRWSTDGTQDKSPLLPADPLLSLVRRAVLNPWDLSPASSLPRP